MIHRHTRVTIYTLFTSIFVLYFLTLRQGTPVSYKPWGREGSSSRLRVFPLTEQQHSSVTTHCVSALSWKNLQSHSGPLGSTWAVQEDDRRGVFPRRRHRTPLELPRSSHDSWSKPRETVVLQRDERDWLNAQHGPLQVMFCRASRLTNEHNLSF